MVLLADGIARRLGMKFFNNAIGAQKMYIELLQEMFAEMVEKKNVSLVSQYYHPNFKLYANGVNQNYEELYASHVKIYQTDIAYKVTYDNESFVESGEKCAMRAFIRLSWPDKNAVELDLVLIAEFKEHKIYRVWETCYPDWSQLETFKTDYLK